MNADRGQPEHADSPVNELASRVAAARHDLEVKMLAMGLRASDGWRISEEVRSSMSGTVIALRPLHVRLPGPDVETTVQIGHDGVPR